MGAIVAGGLTGLLNQSSAQMVDGSLKFDSGSQTTLTRTNSSSGNRKTWTLSFWTKRCFDSGNYQSYLMGKTAVTEGFNLRINDPTDQKFYLATVSGSGLTSDAVFRDFSAWMHVVIVYNSTDSTSTDRVRLYVNGERQTFGSGSYPSLNLDGEFNNSGDFGIGYHNGNTALDAYLSEYHFIDGQALDSSYFGYTDPLTNTWRPKKYTGTFTGTNTFYLPMDGNSPIGQDKSGQGNNWTAVNFSGTSNDPDVLKDSPSGAVSGGRAQTGITTTSSAPSNYPTWNPLAKGNINLSDGNLTATPASNDQSCFATLSIPDNGKVYFEFTCIQRGGGGAQSPILGVGNPSGVTLALNPQNSDNNASTWLYGGDGNKTGGGSGSTSYGSAFVAGDTIGVCVDRSNSRIWFSKNNVWQNSGNPNNQTDSNAAFTNVTSTGTLIPFYGNNNSTAGYGSVNFGQKPFKYAPPQGFLPLNSASATPETVIVRPDQYVGVSTWTGNNGIQSINAGLKPDFVWIKGRSNARDHVLFDTIRGPLKTLTTNGTAAEATQADTLTAFNSDGFTIGSQSRTGINNETYVGWSWKAGGNKNTFNIDDVGYASAAAAGLDAGTVNPNKVSVGTKNGFSIIELTTPSSGTTYSFAHGLGAKPSFLIARQYETTGSYYVWHQSLSANNSYLLLNATNAVNTGSTVWASTDMTSTVISDTASGHWGTSEKMLYYAWADVPGLQKFGKYIGNQDADGPFIELGFRPAVILTKVAVGSVDQWNIYDVKRSTSNVTDDILRPNYDYSESADSAADAIDILSNGFKIRTNNHNVNGSTETYIYAAWAEAPAFNLYGAQSNAR